MSEVNSESLKAEAFKPKVSELSYPSLWIPFIQSVDSSTGRRRMQRSDPIFVDVASRKRKLHLNVLGGLP